jgi:hypothetical protein
VNTRRVASTHPTRFKRPRSIPIRLHFSEVAGEPSGGVRMGI